MRCGLTVCACRAPAVTVLRGAAAAAELRVPRRGQPHRRAAARRAAARRRARRHAAAGIRAATRPTGTRRDTRRIAFYLRQRN